VGGDIVEVEIPRDGVEPRANIKVELVERVPSANEERPKADRCTDAVHSESGVTDQASQGLINLGGLL
jgi:hypothetical protein